MHYQFHGDLMARDCKRNIPYEFRVPAGTGRIDIRFRFAPSHGHGIPNLLTLTLFDPRGFRGARHRDGAEHEASISATDATPGYLPGPLPAGTWTAEIDTHMIMPGEPVHYTLDIDTTAEVRRGTPTTPSPKPHGKPPQRGAGWYRGDLHTHTHHSDAGEMTVADLVQSARDFHLDFIFLTDHNTTAGLAQVDALASEDLLTMGGLELTTFWGHALCLGTRDWVDWRIRPGTGEMARLAAATYANDQAFVIAHPQSRGEPACTGCTWRFGEMMPGSAELIEIWNGRWNGDSNNEQALVLWYDWLNQGLHLVGTAGTDTHSPQDYAAKPAFNVVFAQALTQTALLGALRAGHLFLSAGPHIELTAQTSSGDRWMAGDTINEPAAFTVAWTDCPEGRAEIRLIANGRPLHRWEASARGEYHWSMAPDQANWVVAEIRGENDDMIAITNPIFLGQRNGK